ncbi:MAG: hypothetical protein C0504_08400 [Candidatus Solibacter sp.]|nr:hypothetical protein [Candidatus Solibacter sp.]
MLTPMGSTVLSVAAILAAGFAGGTQPAWGQSKAHGTYMATVKIAGTEIGGETKRVACRAEVKMSIPVTDGNPSRAVININDMDEPSAKVTITQWDLEERNASANSAGQITSWKCRLAAPVTVPMGAAGVWNLNYGKRTYSMSVALGGVGDVRL